MLVFAVGLTEKLGESIRQVEPGNGIMLLLLILLLVVVLTSEPEADIVFVLSRPVPCRAIVLMLTAVLPL